MSLSTPPPSGLRPPDSVQVELLRFLNAHLDRKRIELHSYDLLRQVVSMIDEVSLLLFPHSHVLHNAVKRHIEKLLDDIVSTFTIFGEHIGGKLKQARRAMDELPDLAVAEEERYENLRVWREVLAYGFS